MIAADLSTTGCRKITLRCAAKSRRKSGSWAKQLSRVFSCWRMAPLRPSSQARVYKASDLNPRKMTASEFCDALNTKYLQECVIKIVDQESPISSDVLAKELITHAGIAKMTPKLRERCTYLVRSIEKNVKLNYTTQKLDPAAEDDDSEVIFLWKDGTEMGKVMDFYRVPAEGEKSSEDRGRRRNYLYDLRR
jgi:hypothetical protein